MDAFLTEKILMAQTELVKPSNIWMLFLFLGWSYGSLGKGGKQILFYLTFGGLGLWTVYRLLTLNRAIKKHNNSVYKKYGLE